MNGTALGPLNAICLYNMQVIKKVQVENIKSFDPSKRWQIFSISRIVGAGIKMRRLCSQFGGEYSTLYAGY
jgi:hypothetical protein